MSDRLGVEQLVLYMSARIPPDRANDSRRTGTLRWVMTTAVSLPRTATAVMPDPEMALKAYSECQLYCGLQHRNEQLTDLIQLVSCQL
jgi:hypothetical protein